MTSQGNGNGVRITNQQIYEELTALKQTVDRIDQRTMVISDHEERIRRNEAWRYSIPPAIILASASLAMALIKHTV